jgi:hypothetical protein
MAYRNAFMVAVSATVISGFSIVAQAADVEAKGDLRAVSAINGKIQGSIGWLDTTTFGQSMNYAGGASLSIPVGDQFGLQFDAAAVNKYNNTALSGTAHFFTRDPNSYLIGMIGGFGKANTTNTYYVGPEVELYHDNISIEATAGLMNVNNGVSTNKLFAMADFGLYATENLRFTLGASSINDFKSAHLGTEFLFADAGLPLSLTLDGRLGDDGYKAINAGFTFYFGGDNGKSLMHRHREDDPRNRSLDFFGGASGSSFSDDPCAEMIIDQPLELGQISRQAAPAPVCPKNY